MTRVSFTPLRVTERSAIARFGTDWQLAAWSVPGRPLVFIHPVGLPGEARWVFPSQVAELPPEQDELELLDDRQGDLDLDLFI